MQKRNNAKLEETANYIFDYQLRNGKSPSIRTITSDLKFNCIATTSRYIKELQSRGIIERDETGTILSPQGSVAIATITAPLVGSVACGKPITAIENIEENYYLPKNLFGNKNLFLLKAQGDSMTGVGINDGDFITVEQDSNYNEKDIVVALINNEEATVKRLIKQGANYILHAENPDYDDIIVSAKELKIVGKVVGFIHKF